MNLAELVVALSLATVPPLPVAASDTCATPGLGQTGPDRGTTCHRLTVDGVARSYRIYVPPDAAMRGRLSLLLVLHGGGGTGVSMVGMTRAGFHPLADRDGAVIVYPDALNNIWNDGRADFQSASHTAKVDDVGFLRALVKDLAGRFPVDPARVYATGASNGGMMSIRLACEAGDLFAAVAPVIGSMPAALAESCRPARPVGVMMINGTDDRLVPYEGGMGLLRRGSVLAAEDTARRFAAANGCAALPTTETLPDRDVEDDTRAVRVRYDGCRTGGGVTLYRIEGGGHTWPMGAPYLPRLAGRVSQEIDATTVIWYFLHDPRR